MGKLNSPTPEPKVLCACANKCGLEVSPGHTYIHGHNRRKHPKPIPNHHPCECGCPEMVASDKRFVVGHNPRPIKAKKKPLSPPQPCACGCLRMTKPGNTYIKGHASKGKSKYTAQLCECGCLKYAKPGRRFISGHNKPMLGKHHTEETKEKCRVKPEDFGEKVSKALTGRTLTEEHCKNIGLANIGKKYPKEFGEKISLALTGRHHTEEAKQGMRKPNTEEGRKNKAIANKKTWQNPGHVALMHETHWGNSEWVEKQMENIKKRWADPEWRANQLLVMNKGQDRSPNKPESLLQMITREYHPGFKYTGDLTVWINGKNPDFVNEETKQVIEMYGDYWHDGEDPTDRAEIFAQAGYETCVIWENELQNLDHVIGKLRRFTGIEVL